MRIDVNSARAEANGSDAAETYRKVLWHIMPFLMVCYIVSFVDRSNVGFAKLQFTKDLGFSETVYGIGGGIFYLGYILLEVPSNLYLQKVGVRKTLLRIMVLWGLCCAGLAFMTNAMEFYTLRLVFGAAEAGLFPGIILYISYWVPASRRARFTALFMASIPIAGIVGGPLSGVLMHSMDGVWAMKGWQWLFIIEGLPACLLGFIAYYYLDDKPRDADWITDQQKEIIQSDLAKDLASKPHGTSHSFGQALLDPKLYLVMPMGFAVLVSTGGVFLWLPTIIKGSGVTNVLTIGILSVIPFLVGLVVQYLNGRHSDRTMERRWHVAIPAFVAAAGWGLLPQVAGNPAMSVLMLTLVTAGTLALTGPFWTIPSSFLAGTAAAGGIALISAVAGLGNVISPILVGWLSTTTGSMAMGQYYFALVMTIGPLVLLLGTGSMAHKKVPTSASAAIDAPVVDD